MLYLLKPVKNVTNERRKDTAMKTDRKDRHLRARLQNTKITVCRNLQNPNTNAMHRLETYVTSRIVIRSSVTQKKYSGVLYQIKWSFQRMVEVGRDFRRLSIPIPLLN